ncbi:ABC transporter substrate-binding protein [Streptomyces sp. NPDC087525]|uniref:ABC transporter substrate-binding protein n=1 Tax=Streptomyces sp. NPDC087525 TaxID=3365793 RepID=UPI003813FD80
MTWGNGAYINEARSAVHSGDGMQVNFYHLEAAASRLREQTRRPRTVAKDDRERLYQRFVPPGRFRQASRVLATHHTALLSGHPGSGLRAAALMLLHELPDGRGTLHELPDTQDDDSSTSLFDSSDIHSGDRLLLDLSGADETRYLEVQTQLSDFRNRLMERGAHLVVVLPHHLGYLLRSDLRPLTTDIERPSALRVLTVHLRRDGISPTTTELEAPELTTYLTKAPMRDVADLADRIRRARDTAEPERGFPHWLRDALAVLTDQTARVAGDLSTRFTGRRRALLLALAMFHDTTPATVFSAGMALLKILDHPPDERPRLDHSDLNAEFTAIGAETQPSGRVRFSKVGYDRAVRDHFWTYLPDLRIQLCDWVGECIEGPWLNKDERERVIAWFAEQGLRTGRPEDLSKLAIRWTKPSAPAPLLPDAAQILAHGLADSRHGRSFRQQIYEWSKSAELSPRLKQVLVLVCFQVMAQTHPDQALVRLHHLTRRASGLAGASAQQSLLKLAHADSRLYRLLLSRIDTGMGGSYGQADTALFLALADAARLIRSSDVRGVLASGWAGVLRRWPVERWRSDADRWLTVCEDDRYRDPALDVLVTACAGDSSALGSVYRVAHDWSRAQSGDAALRAEVLTCLFRKMNSAQGHEPLGVGA